jgi:dolichol kinase
MLKELIVAVVSFLYIIVCLTAGELVFRTGLTTRHNAFHFVRIAVTGWIFFAYFGLKNPLIAAGIPAFFFVLNVLLVPRLKRFPVYLTPNSETGKWDPGPILFPFAAAFLIIIYWRWVPDYKFAVVIALLAAGWSAGTAALIDHSVGRYKYQVVGKTKSFEGAVTMFLVTFIAAGALMPTTKIGSGMFLSTSICAAVVATAADNMTPRLTEALAVPLATAAVVLWWVLAV